jgi:hypothetical protein
VDPTIVMDGSATGAAALGFARRRPRRGRVRREPIDLERIAAEFADPAAVAGPSPVVASVVPVVPAVRSEQEILLALEAEVERVKAARARQSGPAVVERFVETPIPAPESTEPSARPVTNVGLPLDQVRAWLDQVQDDLRKVEARVQYLEAEHTRLQAQHQLVAELISSSTPV